MKKILFTLILITVCFSNLKSQTVTIHHKVVHPSYRDTTSYVKFKINNQYFGEKDTIINIAINKKGFDLLEVVSYNDTLRFPAKFKEGETYEIYQGCCCSVFVIRPVNNTKRGTVTLKNKTTRDLGLVAGGMNQDTVKANQTKTLFAHVSAMCRFEPCNIIITETQQLSKIHNHTKYSNHLNTPYVENKDYFLTDGLFLFLHGEKIELDYNDKTKKFDIKIVGYITDEEYKEVYKKL
ncbi:hypothetical protein [Flavobacterium sp. C4GT6]|uniref:hypothetical protein n=1 Tax=Flavobacterium sp. C4GT6 TaxID=3103818 RepID=UPI002ED6A5C5